MTQAARPTLDAAIDDGITLSTKFNNALAALYTSHAGAAAPPSPEKGQTWIDISGEGGSPSLHVMKIYDGTTFRTLGTLNRTTGSYSVAGNLPLTGGAVTGPILLNFGTAAAPGAAFNGDANTGMYRVAEDELGFSTAGNIRLSLTAATASFTVPTLSLSAGSPQFNIDRISGAAGGSFLRFRTGGASKYVFHLANAEAGGNSGSDLRLISYDDGGVVLSNMLDFNRATRRLGINGGPAGDGTLTVRSNGDSPFENNLTLYNPSTGNDAQAKVRFLTGAQIIRGSVVGYREGATNHGGLSFNVSVGGVEQTAFGVGSNKNAYFLGDIGASGAINAGAAINAVGDLTGGTLGIAGTAFVGGTLTCNGVLHSAVRVETPNAYFGDSAGFGLTLSNSYTDGATFTAQRYCVGSHSGSTFELIGIQIPGTFYAMRVTCSGQIFDHRNDGSAYALGGSWVPASDTRLKSEQQLLDSESDLIDQLVPKSYIMNGETRYGFIAQEAGVVAPPVLYDMGVPPAGDPGGETLKGLDYNGILALLVRKVQKLEARIAALEGS